MEDLLQAVSTVGFPIVVAIYLLIRIEPKIIALTSCVEKLTAVVEQDAQNTKENRDAIREFTDAIKELKYEIRRSSNGTGSYRNNNPSRND